MLSGSVRWCLDLISWLIDCLLYPDDSSLFKSLSTENFDLDDLNSRLRESNNVALHLLLASVTRGFLTAICRRLTHLDYTARKEMQPTLQNQFENPNQASLPVISSALRGAYTSIATLTSESIIQIRNFETFLTSISASVKDAYTVAGLPSSAALAQAQQAQAAPPVSSRNSVEQVMLFGGPLPPALVPAMKQLFTSLLPSLRSGIDLTKLFFHDFSILALDPIETQGSTSQPPADSNTFFDGKEQLKSKAQATDLILAHTMDIFLRVPTVVGRGAVETQAGTGTDLRNTTDKKWRRCARCAAVMEDITSMKPAVQFLIMQQRRCFCGGNWDILNGRQVVA